MEMSSQGQQQQSSGLENIHQKLNAERRQVLTEEHQELLLKSSRSRLTFLMLTQIVQLSEILSRLQIAGTYTISLMKNRVVILQC